MKLFTASSTVTLYVFKLVNLFTICTISLTLREEKRNGNNDFNDMKLMIAWEKKCNRLQVKCVVQKHTVVIAIRCSKLLSITSNNINAKLSPFFCHKYRSAFLFIGMAYSICNWFHVLRFHCCHCYFSCFDSMEMWFLTL